MDRKVLLNSSLLEWLRLHRGVNPFFLSLLPFASRKILSAFPAGVENTVVSLPSTPFPARRLLIGKNNYFPFLLISSWGSPLFFARRLNFSKETQKEDECLCVYGWYKKEVLDCLRWWYSINTDQSPKPSVAHRIIIKGNGVDNGSARLFLGMLLVSSACGLPEMLQTIYETESCFSSDGVSGREPSLELLSRAQIHAIPVAGECFSLSLCVSVRWNLKSNHTESCHVLLRFGLELGTSSVADT